MAENLKFLPSVVGPTKDSETTPYYYVFGYDGTNVTDAKIKGGYVTYGVLYNWAASLSACPVMVVVLMPLHNTPHSRQPSFNLIRV